MSANPSKVPVQTSSELRPVPTDERLPFGSLRREMDRLFDDFDRGFLGLPFRRAVSEWEPRWLSDMSPAVDILEKGHAYEITVELPGLDEKNIELKLSGSTLNIKGEKRQEIEEKKENSYLSERHYGAFERSFQVPQEVDKAKIEASFSKGLLTVTLPKSAAAQQSTKTITVKAA
jgi:HSP20 family protein